VKWFTGDGEAEGGRGSTGKGPRDSPERGKKGLVGHMKLDGGGIFSKVICESRIG